MRVKLRYELTVSPQITLEYLSFANKQINFIDDQDPLNQHRYVKEGSSYYVFPTSSMLKVYVRASGNTGFSWKLDVWVNEKKITAQAIKVNADANSRADYNEKINWNV